MQRPHGLTNEKIFRRRGGGGSARPHGVPRDLRGPRSSSAWVLTVTRKSRSDDASKPCSLPVFLRTPLRCSLVGTRRGLAEESVTSSDWMTLTSTMGATVSKGCGARVHTPSLVVRRAWFHLRRRSGAIIPRRRLILGSKPVRSCDGPLAGVCWKTVCGRRPMFHASNDSLGAL